MKGQRLLIAALMLATTACGTRGGAPGRPAADSQVIPPNRITEFSRLYATNCAGCHGPDGKSGAAIGLADPVYLAIADDATIRQVASNGVPGTAMPGFSQHAGGMLTGTQIDVIVRGIRAWAKPDALRSADAPPYAAPGPGDPKRGATVYGVYCSSCHGADGRGAERASGIVGGSYLALVSDQSLRTTVIVGRRDMGAPDWRGNLPGKPMSPQDVSDVVAWLAARRPQVSGGGPIPGQWYSSALQQKGGIR
jgi:mono/diheme cytochrome c family protein